MFFYSDAKARQKPNAGTGCHIRWSEYLGPRLNMRTLLQVALGLLVLGHTVGGLNAQGLVCGDVKCSAFEHCSDYHSQCEPCSSICDETDANYQLEVCQRKCQAYVRHMRSLLRGDVERLWTLVTVAITMACLSLLATICLILERLACWKKFRDAFRRAFSRKWVKRTANGGNGSNNNNNANNNNRTAQTDAEAGIGRQNGLKLAMPTISATVAPSRNDSGNGSSGSGRSATGIANNSTPNTTITTLSRRHPSEDTTLDYAYDNPAMTPSPEAVQLRTKRESSF